MSSIADCSDKRALTFAEPCSGFRIEQKMGGGESGKAEKL